MGRNRSIALRLVFFVRTACLLSLLVPGLLFFPGQPLFPEEPVKIGASLSMSGTYREPADMVRRGYSLWVQEINRQGGLLGRPVELILKDDRGDPELARQIYRQLIEEEEVDLLLSPYGTPLTLAVSEVSEEARMVLLASTTAGGEVWDRGYRYVFGVYSLADQFFIGFLSLIARHGIERVGIIHEENSFNRDAAEGAEEWAGKLGVRVIKIMGFTPGEEAAASVIERAAVSGDAALIICSYPDAGYELLRELRSRPVQPAALAMTITPAHPLFALRVRNLAEGVFAPSHWEPIKKIPYPGTREFIEAFRPFAHMEPSYHAASAFAACQIIAQAVEATGGLDQQKLRDYIAALDTVSIIGRFKVDSTGRQIGHSPLLIQWQGGKKEIVFPEKMKTAEPIF
jgi:branched-chain amino acid transport system substrate-binding protein